VVRRLIAVDERLGRAVAKVLGECLGLSEGQELVVITDEERFRLAQVFQRIAWASGIRAAACFVPVEQQRSITANDALPRSVSAAIGEADSVINCLSDNSDCTRFRGAIISRRRVGLKIAHMPGVTKGMVRAAGDVDYEAIEAECNLYLHPLLRGSEIEIRTGKGYSLTAKLESPTTRRIPVPSSGVIRDGSWGNVPAGETYISPITGSGEGQILIDGSLLKTTVKRGTSVVLSFKNGKLRDYKTDNSDITRRFRELEKIAVSQDDEHCWRNLAEIGIGVNSQISRFSGIAVLDEKKGGTAHIAIGRSLGLGGEVDCCIHEDMVFRRPTILVDGRVVLEDGARVFGADNWLEHMDDLECPRSWGEKANSFSRSPSTLADLGKDGLLAHMYETGPGKSISIQIGDSEVSGLARRVYDLIPEYQEDQISVSDIVTKLGVEKQLALRILHLLCSRRLLYKHA